MRNDERRPSVGVAIANREPMNRRSREVADHRTVDRQTGGEDPLVGSGFDRRKPVYASVNALECSGTHPRLKRIELNPHRVDLSPRDETKLGSGLLGQTLFDL